MNILLLTIDYPPKWGGVARFYGMIHDNWPRHLEPQKTPKRLYVLDNSGGRLVKGRIPFISWLPAIFALYREIKEKKIEKVIVGQVLPLGVAAYVCRLFVKFEYVVLFHGMDYNYAKGRKRKARAMQVILSKAESVFAGNSYLADLIIRDNPWLGSKVRVVNPGVQRDIPPDPGISEVLREKFGVSGKTVMFSLGRLVRRKGFDRAIEAFMLAAPHFPDLEYVIAGCGEDENRLRSIILKYDEPLRARIRLIGELGEKEKWAWLDICDFFVMPAREIGGDFEGFGIVYLEANLAGKPVIAGASGGVADAVKDMSNGLLVDPEDVGDIESAIILLCKDKGLRERLGRQGRELASTRSWRVQVEKFYDQL